MSYHESQSQSPAEQYVGQRTRSVLRLLSNDPTAAYDHPELREEFLRLFQLLQRIEELAERDIPIAATVYGFTDSTPAQDVLEPSEESGAEPESELGPELVKFDPAETSGYAGEDESTLPDCADQRGDADAEGAALTPDSEAEHKFSQNENQYLARWWVNFNGDVSLERLAEVRRMLTESPFTIEVRFDEITDGLIVMRVVTEHHLRMDQMDWLISHIMQLVGMDRNAAIVSRN